MLRTARGRSRALGGLVLVLLALPVTAAPCIQAPLPSLTITSNFGDRWHPVLKTWRPHNGADFRAPVGTDVMASSSGRVTVSKFHPGGGNMITLQGSDGITTTYFHNERRLVEASQSVSAGQTIAHSGNTGEWTTGPHLHFEVRPNGGSPVDPRPYLCSGSTLAAGAGPETAAGPGAPPGQQVPPTVNGAPNSVPPASSFPNSTTAVSKIDFMASETGRRFLNPQWHREIIDPLDNWRAIPANKDKPPPPLPEIKNMLLREIVYMLSLDRYMAAQLHDQRARRMANRAVELAGDASEYNDRILGLLRTSATAANR